MNNTKIFWFRKDLRISDNPALTEASKVGNILPIYIHDIENSKDKMIMLDMDSKKIDYVIIEASSHGLHQKRMNNLNLTAGIFTNFSQDHLDYHKTMKSYLNSKLILFKHLLKKKKKYNF